MSTSNNRSAILRGERLSCGDVRDTFENWQSEFLQLLWRVVGLTILLYVGSPQSKESEDRDGAVLEEILRKVDPKGSEAFLARLNAKFPKK